MRGRMKIKIESILISKAKDIGGNTFVVKDLKFNAYPQNLEVTKEDSRILNYLKYCINKNNNLIDYLEVRELVDTTNIIGANYSSEEEFNSACKFEFRNYFDLEECEYIYVNQ